MQIYDEEAVIKKKKYWQWERDQILDIDLR